MTHAINVEAVTFAYDDRPVLRDVTMSIDPGEFVGLIGPNGSGKTTLLKIMLGLQTPDDGRVELFGTPARKFTDGTRLGYVSQQSTEAETMMPVTVREVVTMGRYPHAGIHRLSDDDHAIVDESLEKVGISELADRRINRLSGGQRQRTYIARALASEADLLALDEPTVGVDTESVDQFYDLLNELNRDGITIVLIEHDIGVVIDHADTIACLDCELYEHCETAQFLETDALDRAFSSTRGVGTAASAGGD
ncbi:metal ABC transporter ATP-binding protein [Natrarchaeobaculum sulfurireducens]|uniref:Cobalamin import ATP-binding protein BtuD n=1 Tax=Natrarchaeobaculum sulfurireducens TaxID=2044521 RepID=A0A346PMR9_9EURY|nr:metal ABC transporter ATP-binding protein [Natrarchaeobaculum sulfurireducens]AXR79018.1 ABC-type Mn/Zn transport system, ATPase component [Natrarchaeobaculum sulfurireducens]AXR80814.1 Zinc ABC transporter, ATP-binding protein ZnuC [Natrarchaeobaculum sulfurireducens]